MGLVRCGDKVDERAPARFLADTDATPRRAPTHYLLPKNLHRGLLCAWYHDLLQNHIPQCWHLHRAGSIETDRCIQRQDSSLAQGLPLPSAQEEVLSALEIAIAGN